MNIEFAYEVFLLVKSIIILKKRENKNFKLVLIYDVNYNTVDNKEHFGRGLFIF